MNQHHGRRRGFTLVELLVSMLFLSLVLLGLLMMNSSSTRGSMDAYLELLAFTLAKEPIEVFRNFGYEWTTNYPNHPLPKYPLGNHPVVGGSGIDRYPFDEGTFEREISLHPFQDPQTKIGMIRVRVTVRPRTQHARAWFSRKDGVSLEALLFEEIK